MSALALPAPLLAFAALMVCAVASPMALLRLANGYWGRALSWGGAALLSGASFALLLGWWP